MNHLDKIDAFTKGYIECIEWLTINCPDWQEENPSSDDPNWSSEALETIRRDCRGFVEIAQYFLDQVCKPHSDYDPNRYTWSKAGHDFWLTRNGHGAGFWDRDLGETGDQLTKLSEDFGECDTYLGDDGNLYLG